jgi:hypothetical protein
MFEREPVRVDVPGCKAADRATAAGRAAAAASTAASPTVRFGSHRDPAAAGPVDRPARPPVATVPS